jgi:hypothetical protein
LDRVTEISTGELAVDPDWRRKTPGSSRYFCVGQTNE